MSKAKTPKRKPPTLARLNHRADLHYDWLSSLSNRHDALRHDVNVKADELKQRLDEMAAASWGHERAAASAFEVDLLKAKVAAIDEALRVTAQYLAIEQARAASQGRTLFTRLRWLLTGK